MEIHYERDAKHHLGDNCHASLENQNKFGIPYTILGCSSEKKIFNC